MDVDKIKYRHKSVVVEVCKIPMRFPSIMRLVPALENKTTTKAIGILVSFPQLPPHNRWFVSSTT